MTTSSQNKINTQYNEIWLDAERILWVRITEVTEIDLDEVMACFAVYRQLGCEQNKVLQIIDARNSVTMTKEAYDYVGTHGHRYFIATAVISHSLSVRLILNFFNFLYPKTVPLKMFASEKEALKWLRKFREKPDGAL